MHTVTPNINQRGATAALRHHPHRNGPVEPTIQVLIGIERGYITRLHARQQPVHARARCRHHGSKAGPRNDETVAWQTGAAFKARERAPAPHQCDAHVGTVGKMQHLRVVVLAPRMRGRVGKGHLRLGLAEKSPPRQIRSLACGERYLPWDLANALWHRVREPAVPGSPIGQIRTDISRPSRFIPPADLINHRACGVISLYSAALWPTPECRSSYVGVKFRSAWCSRRGQASGNAQAFSRG